MSYSFTILAATKALAAAAVAAELDKVVERDPVHTNDHALAEAAVQGMLELTREPAEGEELRVMVSGSLGWQKPDPVEGEFTSAGFSANIYLGPKT